MGSVGAADVEAQPGKGLGSNAEQADGSAERVVPLGSDDEVNAVAPTGLRSQFNKFIWHGGSVYDAWLNAASAQVHSFNYLGSSSQFHVLQNWYFQLS